MISFEELKWSLTIVPIVHSQTKEFPFECICDESDVALKFVLGQRVDKIFHPIHYASKTMNTTRMNYTVPKKNL